MSPDSPKATWDSASSSESMVTTTSAPLAAATLAASCAPSSMSALARPGVRLKTLTSWPAFARLAAMAAPMCPSPISPTFMESSPGSWHLGALQRGHELRAHGIHYRGVHDEFDQGAVRAIERPARHVERRFELIRATCAPERHADA